MNSQTDWKEVAERSGADIRENEGDKVKINNIREEIYV
jgi:hypothetical protein